MKLWIIGVVIGLNDLLGSTLRYQTVNGSFIHMAWSCGLFAWPVPKGMILPGNIMLQIVNGKTDNMQYAPFFKRDAPFENPTFKNLKLRWRLIVLSMDSNFQNMKSVLSVDNKFKYNTPCITGYYSLAVWCMPYYMHPILNGSLLLRIRNLKIWKSAEAS